MGIFLFCHHMSIFCHHMGIFLFCHPFLSPHGHLPFLSPHGHLPFLSPGILASSMPTRL
jgi:hypothetical protein